MSENPYEAPAAQTEVIGIRGGGTSKDVQQVATYQKGLLYCILAYLIMVGSQFFLPETARIFLGIGMIVIGLTSAVFVILLSMKVYHPALGILFAILTCVPLLGLIVLLFINQKATNMLKQNGIEVGLLGAKTPIE